MVNTAHSSPKNALGPLLAAATCAFAQFGSFALAQSAGAFATVPYVQGAPSLSEAQIVTGNQAPSRSGPRPVVMFVGKAPTPPSQSLQPPIRFIEPPPETAVTPAPGPSRPYSIVNQAQIDAASSSWNPANFDAVIAPPLVRGVQGGIAAPAAVLADPLRPTPRRRSAITRIVQDSGRGLVHDLPEALADALPWVDRAAKNEPFDAVLDRVASDLQRAAQADPAWAIPAQRELRALSRRLDQLPEPPPLQQHTGEIHPDTALQASLEDRPFRPRPIWPGASGRPEAQVRPVTLTTTSVQQQGLPTAGIAARYVRAAEDDDGNPPPPPTAPPARRDARPSR